MILAFSQWYVNYINFWILALISVIPSLYSSYTYLKKPFEQKKATFYAIRNAVALFTISIVILIYFISLQF